MTWLSNAAGDDFERVFSLRPNLYAAWREFAALFWEKRLVDPVILELCRLRIAAINGSRACERARTPEALRAGLDEAKISALDAWWQSDRFSPAEAACLRFAEQFALDAQGIRDEDARAVVAALGDAGMVGFVEALAIFDGFSRFCTILDVAPSARAAR